MKVSEAIEALSKFDPNMDIFMAERSTEFTYGLVNDIYTKTIPMLEDECQEVNEETPWVEVVIFDEQ